MIRHRPRAAPVSPLVWVRRLLLPALAVGVALSLFGGGFDRGDVRADLAAGRVDAALAALQRAPAERVIPELAAVGNWQTGPTRDVALARLRARAAAGELYEDAAWPTLVSPLGAWREPPRAFVLREPAEGPLRLHVAHVELGLEVADVELPAGTVRVEPEVPLLVAGRYVVSLFDGVTGTAVALAQFEVLRGPVAHDLGLVLAAAHELGPTPATRELLAAVAALHFGLAQEAARRAERAAADPAVARVARELHALALDELGLDLQALAVLDTAPAD